MCSSSDRWEDLALTIAMRTHKATHVLYNSYDREFSLLAEVDFLSDIT